MSCWTIAAAKAPCDCGALPTFSTLGELCPLGDGSDLHDFGRREEVPVTLPAGASSGCPGRAFEEAITGRPSYSPEAS